MDEYEAYNIYRLISRLPFISNDLRRVLLKAADDELKHYTFWSSLVGDCSRFTMMIKAILYIALFILFGMTFTLKMLEIMERGAITAYSKIIELRPDLANEVKVIKNEEEVHEKAFIEGIDEERARYLGSIALGISDALVELTGIYAGSLGAFASNLSAGLTGLLAGIAGSISMSAAAYTQARHDRTKNPLKSSTYTGIAYISVTLALALPYFTMASLIHAFIIMLIIASMITAYMSLYTSVLHDRKFIKEFAETSSLLFSISLMLYLLGSLLRGITGINVID